MAPGDHASHSEVRLAEVDLALAGQPVEQEEPLRLAGVEPGGELLAPAPHVPSDRRVGALEPSLRDEAVVDPLRGMALLAPAAPVFQEPRVDQGPRRARAGATLAPRLSRAASPRGPARAGTS